VRLLAMMEKTISPVSEEIKIIIKINSFQESQAKPGFLFLMHEKKAQTCQGP
jgi:hypothetical protein